MIRRLSEALTDAGIPMEHILGVPPDVTFVFQSSATDSQKAQAQIILDTFEWSGDALDTWLTTKELEREKERHEVDQTTAALVKLLLKELNILRSKVDPVLPPRTPEYMRNQIRGEIT